ncbi:MAG: hypothetical protein K2J62_06065 [Bacteroidales bacterium]|nr:hypothetical protein [Bacteroidales bacterium]
MKKISTYILVLVAFGIAAISCQKAPSKAEVEAGFSPAGPVPSVGIGNAPDKISALDGYVTVTAEVSGITDQMEGLSLCFLSSTNVEFSNARPVEVAAANGTVTADVPVSAGRKNYVTVSISCADGVSYSDVMEIDVPDVPFWAKVSGTYTGTVVSLAYGDEYVSVITVILDENDPENKCIVGNLEPYFYSEGNTMDEGYNFVEAQIDNENACIIIPNGSSLNLGGRTFLGLNAADDDSATAYADGILYLTPDADALVRPYAFYTLSNGEPEDLYAGAVYTKN